MTQLGSKQRFGVTFELDAQYGGVWLYGKFCYWIDNRMVGDYDFGTSLRDVLFQMQHVVGDCGNRQAGALCHYEPEDIFSALDGSLYSGTDVQHRTSFQMIENAAHYEVRIPVDVFDDWKIYLVDCDDEALLLYKRNQDPSLSICRLHSGEFDEVIRSFNCALTALYERELGIETRGDSHPSEVYPRRQI